MYKISFTNTGWFINGIAIGTAEEVCSAYSYETTQFINFIPNIVGMKKAYNMIINTNTGQIEYYFTEKDFDNEIEPEIDNIGNYVQ